MSQARLKVRRNNCHHHHPPREPSARAAKCRAHAGSNAPSERRDGGKTCDYQAKRIVLPKLFVDADRGRGSTAGGLLKLEDKVRPVDVGSH